MEVHVHVYNFINVETFKYKIKYEFWSDFKFLISTLFQIVIDFAKGFFQLK